MIAIYARVSTEEQAKKGYSLKDQIRECRRIADPHEIIMEYIDEGVSGEFLDRPALSELRKDIRDGKINMVICLDPDRLSRKLMNQLIISEEIEKKARLVFVNGEYKNTPEGKLFYQMRGAISEFEKAKINERFCRGRREKARQGRVIRDYGIYGYDYNDKLECFEINLFEAEIVKMIFDLFMGKDEKIKGINGIANYLTGLMIPTKRGAQSWHRQVVRQILMNRAYIGEFYQNRWNSEGMLANRFKDGEERIPLRERPRDEWILIPCPKIIDEKVFEYVQKLMEESRRRWAGKSKNQYLLSGLLRCAVCGNTMTGRLNKSWGKYIFEYTDSKPVAGTKNKGCGKRLKAEEVDKAVWSEVLNWLSQNIEVKSLTFNSEKALKYNELSNINRNIERVRKGRQNLINMLSTAQDELDELTIGEVSRKLAVLKQEEEKLTEKRKQIKYIIDFEGCNINELKSVKDVLLYYIIKSPEEISFEDKKELLRYAVKEIKVFEDEIHIHGF